MQPQVMQFPTAASTQQTMMQTVQIPVSQVSFVFFKKKQWYFVSKIVLTRKNCSSDREKLIKFEVEGREFAKILRS
jgi:hypothetical protein